MPIVERSTTVKASVTQAFDLSQSYALRLDWDPFVKEQHPLGGATEAGQGVRTSTTSRHGLVMITEYLTYHRPTLVGMKMVTGPRIFTLFSGSWRFVEIDADTTRVVFRYNFTCRPKFLAPIMHRIGVWYLGRDIQHRIDAFRTAIDTTDILSRLAPPAEPA
jgi:hypothetical protein